MLKAVPNVSAFMYALRKIIKQRRANPQDDLVALVQAEEAGDRLMRRTLGVAVFAGMLSVTLFGIFLTPVFFFVIQAMADSSKGSRHHARP